MKNLIEKAKDALIEGNLHKAIAYFNLELQYAEEKDKEDIINLINHFQNLVESREEDFF